MKLNSHHRKQIAHCYAAGLSPLEISEELDLTFRQVCNYIDAACLRKPVYFIARNVVKATRAGIVQIPPCQ